MNIEGINYNEEALFKMGKKKAKSYIMGLSFIKSRKDEDYVNKVISLIFESKKSDDQSFDSEGDSLGFMTFELKK